MRLCRTVVCLLLCSQIACVLDDSFSTPYKHPPPPRNRHRNAISEATPAPLRSLRRPVPAGVWRPKSGRISPRWTCIVLHHSATPAGDAQIFDRHHRGRGWDELGYHFVIGNGTDTPDGMVEVGPRWEKQKHGAHCKTPNNYYNEHGIGICLVGDFTARRPSRAQMDSLGQLVRFLSRACSIPPERVMTHRALTHKTACPGKHFPFRAFQQWLSPPENTAGLAPSWSYTAAEEIPARKDRMHLTAATPGPIGTSSR